MTEYNSLKAQKQLASMFLAMESNVRPKVTENPLPDDPDSSYKDLSEEVTEDFADINTETGTIPRKDDTMLALDGGAIEPELVDADILDSMVARENMYQDILGGVSVQSIIDNITTGGSLSGGNIMGKIISGIYESSSAATNRVQVNSNDSDSYPPSGDSDDYIDLDDDDSDEDILHMQTALRAKAEMKTTTPVRTKITENEFTGPLRGGYIPPSTTRANVSRMFPYVINGTI